MPTSSTDQPAANSVGSAAATQESVTVIFPCTRRSPGVGAEEPAASASSALTTPFWTTFGGSAPGSAASSGSGSWSSVSEPAKPGRPTRSPPSTASDPSRCTAAGVHEEGGAGELDTRHAGTLRHQVDGIDAHREVLPGQRRLLDARHADRHVIQGDRSAHLVAAAGREAVHDRGPELA